MTTEESPNTIGETTDRSPTADTGTSASTSAATRTGMGALTGLWPIAVARVLIGVLWLYSLRWKLPPSFDGGSERGLRDWLALEVEFAAFEPYGRLIDSLVLPNFTFFAWLLFFVELIVGLSLLLGYQVRIGSLIGLGLSLNLGIGLLEVPGEWPWSYAMLAMWHGLFFVSDAGRVFGLDTILRKGRHS